MKIKKFKYSDKSLDWSLDETSFDRLTLLVGASGVGKTQILRAIETLKRIANGDPFSGVNWFIEFETVSGENYIWEGEFENKGVQIFSFSDFDAVRNNRPKIIKETLTLNGSLVINRTIDDTEFNGKKTPKLSPNQSMIHILKEENLVQPVHQGLKKIIFSDQSNSRDQPFRVSAIEEEKLVKQYSSLKEIQECGEDIRVKLYLVSKADPETFNKIKERVSEIFPKVEDFKIEPLIGPNEEILSHLGERPIIQMKEKGVSRWIEQWKISSGMFRTLIQICELYLCAEGTVFLIDEFENSLGINCIDELTNDIINSERQLQFIITSHHPYIINNIDFSNWKLVTRNAGVIKATPISKFISGKSHHEKFMQLLQLEEYQTGTA